MTPSFEAIGGARVHALVSARAGAPRVLILAPWPLTLRSLYSAWPLLRASLDVVAIDLPGFGHSDRGSVSMSPSGLAQFLTSALDHFGFERAHLVGTDVGVPTALSLAASSPDRLRSLVLCDGPGTTDPPLNKDLRRMVGSAFYRWMFALAPGTFVHTAVRNGYLLRHPSKEDVADYVAAYRTPGQLAGTLDFVASYPTELPRIDGALSGIEVPALLLWGGEDRFVPPQNAELLHQRLARSEVQILKGTGHFSNDDDPEGWAKAVVAWCLRQDAVAA